MSTPIFLVPTEGSKSFTNFSFYNNLLEQLTDHYSRTPEKPILSFEELEWIEPSVLPNLVGLGLYLKQYHNEMIELRLKYNPKLLKYLEDVGFFNLIGERTQSTPEALEIFAFNKDYLGGYSVYDIKETRVDHKIRCYTPRTKYFEIKNKVDKEIFRDELIEELESFVLRTHFSEVLYDKEITGENIDETYERLAEPISNGMLHSGSHTIVMMQTTKFNTKISISDVGKGFEKSFIEKDIAFDLIEFVNAKHIYQNSLHDFYMIQQILLYSMTKTRKGFLDFIIDVVIINNGTVRIHYNSTQIVLTTAFINELSVIQERRDKILTFKLNNPNLNTGDVYENLYKDSLEAIVNLGVKIKGKYKSDLKRSPLRLYKVKLQGIHIEIDLI